MANHYHLDCSSGIAGDMFLGACLDLGMPLDVLHDTVARLRLPGITVESRKASRGGFIGTRFRVLVDGRPLEGPDPEEPPPPITTMTIITITATVIAGISRRSAS